MKFLHHLLSSDKPRGFDKIEGYEDVKDIVMRALYYEHNYNLLFTGPPASAKTLFLLGILDIRKDGVYFDGSNTTNRILDVLEEERPKVICIDELDKMPRTFQNKLLNFLESGRVKQKSHFLRTIRVIPGVEYEVLEIGALILQGVMEVELSHEDSLSSL